jgi:hypothetical protein
MMDEVNLRYTVSTFVNVTMYPQYSNNMIIKIKKKACAYILEKGEM